MTTLKLSDQSTFIPDDKLIKFWKHAVTLSLSPDNTYPAYKIYYMLLSNEIATNKVKLEKNKLQNEEVLNDEENLHY